MKQTKRHSVIKKLAESPMKGLSSVALSFSNEEFEAAKQITIETDSWESMIAIQFN